jgi:hypothetical protein
MFLSEDEMKSKGRIIFTVPRQLPLFEEQQDGRLTQYKNEQ